MVQYSSKSCLSSIIKTKKNCQKLLSGKPRSAYMKCHFKSAVFHQLANETSHIRISFTLFKDFIVKATLKTSSENVLNTFDMNEKDFKTKTAFSFTKHVWHF